MQPLPLPITFRDLLDERKVESDRIEFKEGWNPTAIMRTVCAFANDFRNYGGGYIVIGVEQANGLPVLPAKGIPLSQLDTIQRELLNYCHLMHPPYFPILGMESVNGCCVVILWCPGGQHRPYRVPRAVTWKDKDYACYIRRYANTIAAKDEDLRELISLTATIPFDDRIQHRAVLEDLRLTLIRGYLHDVRSELYTASDRLPFTDLCRQMAIVDGPDEFLRPRNVGLLFFHDDPSRFFPGTQIDVVHLPEGAGGNRLEEAIFKGPIHQMLREALQHIQNSVVVERITKQPDRAEAVRIFNYPFPAIHWHLHKSD